MGLIYLTFFSTLFSFDISAYTMRKNIKHHKRTFLVGCKIIFFGGTNNLRAFSEGAGTYCWWGFK